MYFWANYFISLQKSHHFRTHFLYMIRYKNTSRPPCGPRAQNLARRDPNPQDLSLCQLQFNLNVVEYIALLSIRGLNKMDNVWRKINYWKSCHHFKVIGQTSCVYAESAAYDSVILKTLCDFTFCDLRLFSWCSRERCCSVECSVEVSCSFTVRSTCISCLCIFCSF